MRWHKSIGLVAAVVSVSGQNLGNDLFIDRIPLTGASLALTASNRGASREAGEVRILGDPGGSSVWWSWTAPLSGKVVIDLGGSDFDTLLAICLGKSLGFLNVLAADDNSGSNSITSRVIADVVGGNDYNIVVDGRRGASGSIRLSLRLITLPEITAEPQDRIINERQNASFAVVALAAEPVGYQWQFNGASLPGKIGPVLDLSAVTIDQAGSYAVVISNHYGQVKSRSAMLTVFPAPKITVHPQSQTVDAGANATFSVDAAGREPLSFQWFFMGAPLLGQTNKLLSLTGVSPRDEGPYWAVVTNAAGSDTSTNAQLRVLVYPPVVTKQPLDRRVDAGDPVTFAAEATGTQPLSFQWLFNNSALLGATNTQLFLAAAATNQAGSYSLRVTNEFGITNSRTATLQVIYHLPVITNQPADLLVVAGQNATFSVRATGSNPLRYQWSFNGASLAGETSDSLALFNLKTNQTGFYSVQVSNDFGATNSRSAKLTVVVRPPNDNFADRIEVLATNTLVLGWNNYASREALEPVHAGLSPGPTNSVWWHWTAPDVIGLATIDLLGSSFDTVLAVYQGADLASLQPVKSNNNSVDGGLTSKVLFQTDPLATYIIAVDGAGGAQGDIRLIIRFTTDIEAPVVTLHPADFVCFGLLAGGGGPCEDAFFSVEAESIAKPIWFQWQFRPLNPPQIIDLPGATNSTLTLNDVTIDQAGSYWAIVGNAGGNTTSRVATLRVTATPGMLSLNTTNKLAKEGENVSFVASYRGCPPLTNQWRFNGQPISGANTKALQLNRVTPLQAGWYDLVVSNPGGAITSQLARLEVDATPKIDQQPQPQNVRDGETATFSVRATSFSPLQYQWQREGVEVLGATNSILRLLARPFLAGDYRVLVSNPWAAVTSQVARLSVDGRPRIDRQPQGRNARDGEDILLQVAVSSYSPIRYRWQWNTQDILDATNATYSFRASLLSAGDYRVVVSNDWASVTSQVARVTTSAEPIIRTQPADQKIKVGDPFQLQVLVDSYSPLTFLWSHNGNPVLLDTNHAAISIGTNSSFQVLSARTNDSGNYQVVVSNAVLGVTSRVAVVRVVEPPANDHFSNSFPIIGPQVTVTGHNEFATKELGEPNHAKKPGGRSVWWSWTAPEPGTNTVDLSGSRAISGGAFDTLLGIYTGARVEALAEVAADDQSGSDGRTSKATFAVEKGVTYHIAVDGNSREEGTIKLALNFDQLISPPVIMKQPESQAVRVGASATFTVEARGSPRILMQWQFNDADLPGETNATLTLSNLQLAQEGNYSVVLRNAYGAVRSDYAQLTFGAIIRGMVTDATNGEPIPGARISAGGITNYTDLRGNYRLIGVKPGSIQSDFDADKRRVLLSENVQFRNQSTIAAVILYGTHTNYFDYVNDQIEVPSGQTITLSFSMSPKLDGLRFVLNWGLNPADLDGYLQTPAISGTNFLIHYLRQYKDSTNSPPFAVLDHDVTTSYGPETITVYQFFPGTYRYYVKKYNLNAAGDLPGSGATVKLYTSEGLYGSRKVPATGNGRFWHVCDVFVDNESTNVIWFNRLQDAQPLPLSLPPVLPEPWGDTTTVAAASSLILQSSDSSSRHLIQPLGLSRTQTNFFWDFGDASSSIELEPAHQYKTPGRFSVTLKMTYVRGEINEEDTEIKREFITVINRPPQVAITYPGSNQLFRAGTTVPIRIDAFDPDIEGSIAKLELFEGSRKLGEFNKPPYEFKWDNAPEGAFVFTARATDNFGAVVLSSPIPIKTLDLSGDIVVIRNFPDPEITQLTNYVANDVFIYDTGQKTWRNAIPRVLDQEGLWFHLVESFKLVIWHDLGKTAQGLTTNDVDVFYQAFTNGISLYFMGEALASSVSNLTEPQLSQWLDLIHLRKSERPPQTGPVLRTNMFTSHPLLDSYFGLVNDFSYPSPMEQADWISDFSEVVALGQGSPVMIAYPAFGREDTRGVRTATQNFFAFNGAEEASLDERRKLFLNTVYWLMHLNCQQVNMWLRPSLWITNTVTGLVPIPDRAEIKLLDEVVYALTLQNNMECDPSGVLVTDRLSPLLRFDSASAPQGQWHFDSAAHQVVFRLFRVPKGEPIELTIHATAVKPGLMTNLAVVDANYALAVKSYETVNAVAATLPNVAPRLTLQRGAYPDFLLRLDGEAGFSYTILSSPNLNDWAPWTNLLSTSSSVVFPERFESNAPVRFYRVISP